MEKTRDSFRSRWGFIFACIGSAVGMGNIWMFPTRVSMYGGGSFLIPYFLFVILIGSTGVIGEMSFGRATRSGPIGAFGAACETRGNRKVGEALGLVPTLGSMALAIGYTVVMGWILKYMIGSFTGSLLAPATPDEFGAAFGTMASSFGNNLWQSVALVLALLILIFGIGKGIERANKVMMPVLFFLFVGLAVYVAFQPGAALGYQEIFRVDPAVLAKPMTWVYALGQAFFSLSVAGNGTLIYGSYLSDKEDIPKSARSVAFFDTLAACLAALVIIPAMAVGAAGSEQGSIVGQSGPGLMFIALPNLFKTMPGGTWVAVVFFVAVMFAGLTSLINLYEAPIATLQEKFGLKRLPAVAIIGGIGLVVSLCIQGIVSGWMDIVSIFICPLGAGLAGVMFFWVAGKGFVEAAVNNGREKPIGAWFYPLAKYGFCGLCGLVLIVGAISYIVLGTGIG
ncbi:MAG: sodium-dependent transporter [Clostridia bacterium]|nr:sodium-dependent transporter [Clostridia bacterium]